MKATPKSICSHCTKPYWGLCVHSLSISITAKFESWVALQKYPLNFLFRFWAYIFCTKWKQNVCTECCYSTSFNDWFLPFFQGEEYVAHTIFPHIRPAGIIILHSLQMRVLLENTTFLLHKIVRIAGIIRVAGIIRGRALYEEIR